MRGSTLFTLALVLAAPALAQQSGPAQPGLPMPPTPGPALAASWHAAQAAISACRPEQVTVAVLDSAGTDKLIAAGDGARGRMVDFARRKAMTALTFSKPSMTVRDEAKADPTLAERLKTDSKLIGFGGGLPILRDGKLLGAIAVAGGSTQELDQKCASAGLAALK